MYNTQAGVNWWTWLLHISMVIIGGKDDEGSEWAGCMQGGRELPYVQQLAPPSSSLEGDARRSG